MTTNQAMIWLIAQAMATLTILTVGTLAAAGLLGREKPAARPAPSPDHDIVDTWGRDSFPASDPPANW